MNETESYERLSDQIPGHFLLRISSSKAHDGVFVLAVKTRGSGVVQIQIKVTDVNCKWNETIVWALSSNEPKTPLEAAILRTSL